MKAAAAVAASAKLPQPCRPSTTAACKGYLSCQSGPGASNEGGEYDPGSEAAPSLCLTVEGLADSLARHGFLLTDQEEVGQVTVAVGPVFAVLAVTLVHGADLVCDVVDDGVETDLRPVDGPGDVHGGLQGAGLGDAGQSAAHHEIDLEGVDPSGPEEYVKVLGTATAFVTVLIEPCGGLTSSPP